MPYEAIQGKNRLENLTGWISQTKIPDFTTWILSLIKAHLSGICNEHATTTDPTYVNEREKTGNNPLTRRQESTPAMLPGLFPVPDIFLFGSDIRITMHPERHNTIQLGDLCILLQVSIPRQVVHLNPGVGQAFLRDALSSPVFKKKKGDGGMPHETRYVTLSSGIPSASATPLP